MLPNIYLEGIKKSILMCYINYEKTAGHNSSGEFLTWNANLKYDRKAQNNKNKTKQNTQTQQNQ